MEYDDHAGARHNRPGPLTLDDHDRTDEERAILGLRASGRRRHRVDQLSSPRKGWRYYGYIGGSEQGSGSVEFVAMAVGAIALITILGGAAYHALGCQAADPGCLSDKVASFLWQRLPWRPSA